MKLNQRAPSLITQRYLGLRQNPPKVGDPEGSRVQRIQHHYQSSIEDAQHYLDLVDEGYNRYQASIMAGLVDPSS